MPKNFDRLSLEETNSCASLLVSDQAVLNGPCGNAEITSG